MSMMITFSVTNATLEQVVEQSSSIDVSPQVYLKYLALMALQVTTPRDVAEFRKSYERRSAELTNAEGFKEQLRRVKPIGAF